MTKTLLTTRDVAYATSTAKLFASVSVSVKRKDRIALIGKNGAGKTTLLRLLCGDIEADEGVITVQGSIGYVPQITEMASAKVAISELLQMHQHSYERFCARYHAVFSSEVPQDSAYMGMLSGGEQTKVWIALALMQDPTLVLLDEPTNHLDRKSINELKEWLDHFKGGVIFVSHNRSFLRQAASTIWELQDGAVSVYGGSYDEYLLEKQRERDAKDRMREAVTKELRHLDAGVRKRETKAARAQKAGRKSKQEPSRSKGAEDYFSNRSEKGVGRIKKKQDQLRTKLESSLSELGSDKQRSINIPLQGGSKGKRSLVDMHGLEVTAGSKKLLADVSLRIAFGDRISISGDNGTGKTTLLETILREISSPTQGVTRVGTDVKVEFIDQRYAIVSPELSLLENLEQRMSTLDHELVHKQLGRFQFPPEYLHKKGNELSGGETARLAFAIATIAPVDLLILDEPTNNLDVETVDVIIDAIREFPGALLVVSHDSHFLESVGVKEQWSIEDGVLLAL